MFSYVRIWPLFLDISAGLILTFRFIFMAYTYTG